jgi:hypothetical protein
MILASHGIIGSSIVQINTLLDLYPNAAAAYSLRKLRDAYTGSAIEVRRTNLDVADIGFTSTGELDTTALLAFTGTGALDNGFVTKWYDQSGNGRNATQTTAANQPQIVSGGSVLSENGKPSVQFDGTNDYFISSNTFTHSTKIIVATKPLSAGLLWSAYDGTNSNYIGRPSGFPNGFYYFENTQTFVSESDFATGQHLYFADVTKNLYENTVVKISDTAFTANSYDTLYIGTRQQLNSYFNGKYQELIIYGSDQSSNRTGISDNINDFYSIY